MAYHDIYMTDDIYRPSDADLNPIEQSSSELSMTISGYQYDWYFTAYCRWWDNQADTGSLIYLDTYLMAKGSFPSVKPSLRFVIQALVDDSVVYEDETAASNYYNDSISIYPRSAPSSDKAITRRYEGSTVGATTYNWTRHTAIKMSDIGLIGIPYKIRCKVQRLVNNVWTDVARGGSHGSDPWKTLTSYAPFYQSITPPTHFYANGINRFTAPIGTVYRFTYLSPVLKRGSDDVRFYPSNNIVRSINPPYETSGVNTQYLYFCPGHPLPTSESDKFTTYSFYSELRVTDPSDSDYEILVARRLVSGDVEYKGTDDLSMYGTPTWSLTDPTGMYEQYGVLLRNVASTMTLAISCVSSYGAMVGYRYYKFGEGYSTVINQSTADQSVSVELKIPASGASTTVGVHVTGGYYNLLVQKITIPIVSYAVPSLPTASIHRCDSNGTANDNGDHCRIDWAVAITSINNQNSKKLTIRHPEGTTEFDPLDSYTQSGSLIVAASTESTYGIDFTVSDDLNTITKSLRLSTAQAVMDLLYGGGGIAFGKVASVQNAVEISDLWKLICYKLSLNGIDMNAWVKQLESRVGALEQFAGNTGSTTQFQVSFFNDSELLKRDWVRTGYDAIAPSESPTKEPTDTNTYSFVGWALTNGKQTADANALVNITNHRNIYAAFSSAIRLYTVNFKNGGAVVKTEDDLQYRYSATAPSTNPSKSGYAFAGWCPSGRIVTKNTDAIAQFFDNTEIADSWEEIMESVNDGTVSKRYNQGQYKTLDCGSNGTVIMRIKGFNLDKIANSSKTAKVSWEAIECLAQTRRINPTYNAGEEGTGALGGWGKSELRQWLNGDFFNSIDPVVRNSIKSVGKVSYSRDVNGSGVINSMSLDKIFIPSAEEISGHYDQRGYIYETDGIDFRYMASTFSNKRANGSASYIDYWLRTVGNVGWNSFRYYQDLTNKLYDTSEKLKGICIGFCT